MSKKNRLLPTTTSPRRDVRLRLAALAAVVGLAGCTEDMGQPVYTGGGTETEGDDGTSHDPMGEETSSGTGGTTGSEPEPVVGEHACVQDPDTRVPCAFEELPDPDGWRVDPKTGMRYRRVTEHERMANEWLASAYLVEAGALIDAVEDGGPTMPPLLVPIGDDDAVAVSLDRVMTLEGPEHVTVTPTEVRVERPTFVTYVSSGEQFPEVLFRVTGTIEGARGLAGRGTVGGYDVYVASHADGWILDDMGAGPSPQDLVRVNLLTLTPPQQAAHDSCFQLGGCHDMCAVWAPADCGKLPKDEGQKCYYEGTNMCVNTKPSVDLEQCDNGFDDDGDGRVDYNGVDGMYPIDPNCEHQSGCFANGSVFGTQHHHFFESGEQIVVTGTLLWCGVDGDWASRAFDLLSHGISVFGNATGYDPYDNLAGAPSNVMRWVGSQCWLLPPSQVDACQQDGVCGPFGPESPHAYPFAGIERSFGKHMDRAWDAVAHASENGLLQPATIAGVFMRRKDFNINAWGQGRFPWSSTPGAFAIADYEGSVAGNDVAHEIGHTLGLMHDDQDPVMYSPSVGVSFSPKSAATILDAVRDVQIPRPYGYGK